MVSVLSRRFRRSNSRGSLPTGIGLAGWIEGYEPFPAAHALWRALRREPLIDSFLSVVEAVRDRVETAELCSDVDIGRAINLGSASLRCTGSIVRQRKDVRLGSLSAPLFEFPATNLDRFGGWVSDRFLRLAEPCSTRQETFQFYRRRKIVFYPCPA